jgi:hypothetical protein
MRVHCHSKRGGGVRAAVYADLWLAVQGLGVLSFLGYIFPRPFGNDFELSPQWLPQVRGSHRVGSSNAEQARRGVACTYIVPVRSRSPASLRHMVRCGVVV